MDEDGVVPCSSIAVESIIRVGTVTERILDFLDFRFLLKTRKIHLDFKFWSRLVQSGVFAVVPMTLVNKV